MTQCARPFACAILLCGQMAYAAGVRYVAHRGDYSDAPEGSRPAYSNAVVRGADAIKVDVCRTADGVAVISHDVKLSRTMKWDVEIKRVTYAEILEHRFVKVGNYSDEKIQTLAEGLEYVRKVGAMWLDFKYFSEEFCEDVLKEIARAGLRDDQVTCATYSRSALRYMKAHHPSIARIGHMDFADLDEYPAGINPSFDRQVGCRDFEHEMYAQTKEYVREMGLSGVNMVTSPELKDGLKMVERLRADGLIISLAEMHSVERVTDFRDFYPDMVVTKNIRKVRPLVDEWRNAALAKGENFEQQALGTEANAIFGWRGDGMVVETERSRALQTDVMTWRELPRENWFDRSCRIGLTLRIQRSPGPLPKPVLAENDGMLAVDDSGRVNIWKDDRWTPLSQQTFEDGRWVRVEVCARKVDGGCVCSFRLDGAKMGETIRLKKAPECLSMSSAALDDLQLAYDTGFGMVVR